MVSPRRRTFLGAVLVGTIGIPGCTGRGAPSCETYPTVLELQTKVVRVRMPFRYLSQARALEQEFEAQGYVAWVGADTDFVGSIDDAILEIIGDITRSAVASRVESTDITDYSIRVEDVRESSFSTVGGGGKFPWETPILQRRARYLQRKSDRLGITLPELDVSQLKVGIASHDHDRIDFVENLFSAGGRFTATLVPPTNPTRRPPTFVSGIGDRRRIASGNISTSRNEDGVRLSIASEPSNRYIFDLLHPTRTGQLPPPPPDVSVVFRLDGSVIARRPFTDLERRYHSWFDEHPTEDPPASYRDVPIVLSGFEPAQALRIVGALQAPTGTQNAFSRLC